METTDRRTFLGRVSGGAAALALGSAVGPGSAAGVFGREMDDTDSSLVPWAGDRTGLVSVDRLAERARDAAVEDEEFWELVKRQYPLADDLVIMNAANLCPSPYPVQETVFELTRDVDRDASFQNRAKFADLREGSREALARLLGADADEVAITRNTSESNNTVVNGLDLGPGDRVVLWDQNHPTNELAWGVRAERRGFEIQRVTTPTLPTSADELVAAFEAAIDDRTRVLAFSHVSNVSGVALPARELCRMARERGIYTLIDGAQTFGSMRVDLHDLGCDFYTGSVHKWLTGPKEAGVLYVRESAMPDLWPHVVGVGYDDGPTHGARKYDSLGQRDDAAVAAVETAVRFQEAIGLDLIDERVRTLAGALKREIGDRIAGAEFHTSAAPDRSHGVVVVQLPVEDQGAVYARLYEEHRIAGAPRGGDFPGVRFCPHIYNTMSEVEQVADALATEVARG